MKSYWKDLENPEDIAISKLNSGMLINFRLDALWKDAHKHKRRGEFSKWNADLDAVWCELGGDEKEGGDADEKMNKINIEIGKVTPILNWGTAFGFNKPSREVLFLKIKQYALLIKKELFLRRLQNKQGKGTAYAEEEDDWE